MLQLQHFAASAVAADSLHRATRLFRTITHCIQQEAREVQMRQTLRSIYLLSVMLFASAGRGEATTYMVGPGQPHATPSSVPWESLQAGDLVLIHWRSTPYKDKWVICRQGTATAPIVVRGVAGPGGELPIIEGTGATTRLALDYWGEQRAVIKIGGASVPADTMPRYIVIENLDVRSARPPYTFTDDAGAAQSYVANAAAIWIEKGEHITIRNNRMHDAGNGLFVSSADPNVSRDILIEGNAIFDNGNAGSLFEHNTYTEALGIIYQYNYFGPTKTGANGNNLKDRSAGLIVRYNWIEGGNRQLDLVETDSLTIQNDPSYRETFVYGNVLVETDGSGNRQVTHYGGDSGTTSKYRKGTLFFYNNTLVSYRTDRTTLFRLSTNEEHADTRNNIVYVTAAGNTLSLLDATGVLELSHNWFKPGRVATFGTLSGTINDDGTSVVGSSPGFRDEAGQDFRLAMNSPNVNAGTVLSPELPEPAISREYVKHQSSRPRSNDGILDIGAFEMEDGQPPDLSIATNALASGIVGTAYADGLSASGGVPPYTWVIASGVLPPGLTLDPGTGRITGTPAQSGSFDFIVEVADAQATPDTATRPFTIAIADAPQPDPLAIATTSLPSTRRNKNYNRTLAATGGTTPYSWSIVAGTLPPGLSLNANTGVISGRATSTGNFAFTVQVRDNAASTATKALSIAVTK
jgi:putative Ig domain-containing protein